MAYRVWSCSGFPQELPVWLFGKKAEEWLRLPPNTPNVLCHVLDSFPEVQDWLKVVTLDFQYGDFVNWPRILEDVQNRVSRAEALFQPSGRIFAFSIIHEDVRPPNTAWLEQG